MRATALCLLLALSCTTRREEKRAPAPEPAAAPATRPLPPPPPPCEATELLTNGSFESPSLAPQTLAMNANITGWRLVSGPGIELQHDIAGAAFDGAQHIELDSDHPSAIAQTVSTTKGHRYTLRLAFTAREGTPLDDNQLEVRWNNETVRVLIPPSPAYEWKVYELTLEGQAAQSTLELRDLGLDNSVGTYLDAVSLRRQCP